MAQTLTFYYGSGSPFAWRVWLALEHKQVPYTFKRMRFDNGDLHTPAYEAINPRHKVPAIVDDGFALYESAAIVEYLEDRYAASGARLWPREVRARALARRVSAEVDAYVPAHNMTLVTQLLFTRPEEANLARVAEAKDALTGELARFERYLQGDFIAGADVTAADFALYPFVAFLARIDAKRPGHEMRKILPARLGAWSKRIEALPYFASTYPPHWKE